MGPGLVALVEERADFVALFEAADARANGDDAAAGVRAWDTRCLHGEGVHALGDDEVAVVEGYGIDFDEDVFFAELRQLGFLDHQVVKASEVLDDPLLRRCRCHG